MIAILLALTAVTAAAIDASGRPDPTLVLHYRFETLADGIVRDESGRGNHARAEGMASLVPGRFGRAVAISRSGYLVAAKSDSLELGGEMTLEAWVKPEGPKPSAMRILDRQTIGGSDGFLLDTHPGGRLRLIVAPGTLGDEQPLPLGQWTHVAATYSEESGEMRLYRNGQVVAERSGAGKLRPSEHPLHVGASRRGGDRFVGAIDEVRIYARALLPEEIAAHAQGREIPQPASAAQGAAPPPVVVKDDVARVDHAALMARNDLVFLQPARYPFEAMHVGNGNFTACVWNEDGMTWHLNNGRYRRGGEAVAAGRVRLSTPALSQTKPTKFEQRQRLWEGVVTTAIEGASGVATASSFVAEGDDCLVFRCQETGVGPAVLRLEHWRDSVHFVEGGDFVALTEPAKQEDKRLATGMAIVVAVDGVAAGPGPRDQHSRTLTWATAAGPYTVYVASALVRGSEQDALESARQIVARARAKGYEALLAERQAFWREFWPKSFLHITSSRGEGDFLENLWYLFFYDMASMSRNTLCPKFNGGTWLVADDLRGWGGSYWHQNTREMFWPVYAAGHAELSDPFVELYWGMIPRAAERARATYGSKGLHFWEVSPLDGGGIPKWPLAPSYHNHRLDVALEVALQWWWRYEFTLDEALLRDRIYPLLVGGIDFYLGYAKKAADGKYHIEPANAAETWWAVADPHIDHAALRWAIPLAIRLSQQLGRDADRRGQWKEFLDNLRPFAVDEGKNVFLAAHLKTTDQIHNSENTPLYSTYPYGLFGIGLPDYERAKSTFLQRPFPGMGNGWEPAAIVAARLGLADQAGPLTLTHMRSNLRMSNGGWYSPTGAVFVDSLPDAPYFDAPGVCAQAINEMAIQSHGGIVRLAPAWPAKWHGKFQLHARGGFQVLAEVHAGQVRHAIITSHRGGDCRLANPWHEAAVVSSGGKEIVRSAELMLQFATHAGQVYRLERASEPIASMAFAPLAPPANAGPKFIGKLRTGPSPQDRAYLGIAAEGRTPQRATIERNLRAFQERLASASRGMSDLSTGKSVVQVVDRAGKSTPAPMLANGEGGATATTAVPPGGAVVVDLRKSREVQAVAFSRDRTGVRCDGAASTYVLEGSVDGKTWNLLVEQPNKRAATAGEVLTFGPASVRFLRLKPSAAYGRPAELDEITVYGRGEK